MAEIFLLIFGSPLKVKKQLQLRPRRQFLPYMHPYICMCLLKSELRTSCLLYMAKYLWLSETDSLMYKSMLSYCIVIVSSSREKIFKKLNKNKQNKIT